MEKRRPGGQLRHKVKIEWSSNFAYAVGLIATDGYVSKDARHIFFISKDLEMIENLKRALGIKNKIGRHARGGETEKRYFYVHFGDKVFWQYLCAIGIGPAKSKTIKKVEVPDEFFADFVRGVFDGDGSFYTFWDNRWACSFGFQISFASASLDFLEWLQERMNYFYGIKGFIKRGDGVYEIRCVKGDTLRLFAAMYYKEDILCLSRKYIKLKDALEFDADLKVRRERIRAGLAHR